MLNELQESTGSWGRTSSSSSHARQDTPVSTHLVNQLALRDDLLEPPRGEKLFSIANLCAFDGL